LSSLVPTGETITDAGTTTVVVLGVCGGSSTTAVPTFPPPSFLVPLSTKFSKIESTFFIRFGFPLFGERTGDTESLDPGEGDGTDNPSSDCLDTKLPLLLKETMFDAGSLGGGVTSVVLDMITGLHLSKFSSETGFTDLSFT
jgi:hypothetical protein